MRQFPSMLSLAPLLLLLMMHCRLEPLQENILPAPDPRPFYLVRSCTEAKIVGMVEVGRRLSSGSDLEVAVALDWSGLGDGGSSVGSMSGI
jgi:hypothetical protein